MAQSPRGHCLHVAAHLSSSTLVLQCVAFSRASKGALRCRRWTCESSPISSHHVGYADFPHPLHATIYNHMFSSSSDPTYITSIRKSGVRRCGGVPVVLVLVAAAAVVILGRGMLWSQCLRKYCPFSMRTATRMQHQKLERQDRTFSVAETTILSLTLYVYIYTYIFGIYWGSYFVWNWFAQWTYMQNANSTFYCDRQRHLHIMEYNYAYFIIFLYVRILCVFS